MKNKILVAVVALFMSSCTYLTDSRGLKWPMNRDAMKQNAPVCSEQRVGAVSNNGGCTCTALPSGYYWVSPNNFAGNADWCPSGTTLPTK